MVRLYKNSLTLALSPWEWGLGGVSFIDNN